MSAQLEFFPPDPMDCLRKEVRESSDKVRKSLFARHGDLARKYSELHDRLSLLERNICRGTITM